MQLRRAYKKIKSIVINSYYAHNYYKRKLKDNLILLESKNGVDLAGNIFHILKEVTKEEYKEYDVCLSCLKKNRKLFQERLELSGIQGVKFINTNTYKYYRYMSIAKYLFTDTSFTRSFVKKEGQIITNTWHGTPLKKMGKDVGDRSYAMGNVQRNILYSDYLVYPNEYMKKKMVDAYYLDTLYEGTILNEGYPRNSIFFDKEIGQSIKKELGLENKQVFLYMPTWRGTLTARKTNQFLDIMEYYFQTLDVELKDNQVLYVKLHPFARKAFDVSKYKHIKAYPDKFDAYEFMNMCDCLITDYSSVFYDFANSRKKIVLFAYDETEYIGERGLYVDLKDLPFPVVKTVKGLVEELNSPKNYDDTAFLKECCTYDNKNAAQNICRHVLKGEKVCKEEKIKKNGKKNVLMYGSALAKNGLTTSLFNLFQNIDLEKRNYLVSFTEMALKKSPRRVERIPKEVGMVPISSEANFTIFEAIAYILYFKKDIDNKFTKKYLDRLYKRELIKHFGGIKIDYCVQFAGYEKKIINMFQRFDVPRVIYVHSDMVAEINTRANQHYLTLKSAYQNYNKVAVVTEDMVPPTVEISGKKENIVIVNNCHAHKEVIEKSKEEMEFEPETKCNYTLKEVGEIVNSDALKFITIGRFSPEKGHTMLLKAFEKFSEKYPDTYLIIIGGHGKLYAESVKFAAESKANIVIIRSMQNPMPILRKCDFYILSSLYEGLGLTMLEADTLGIPCMCTDIPGPRGFVKENGGYLVEPNENGLLSGMNAFMKGKVKAMNVDYNVYNSHAVEQFESLFEEYEK